VTSVTGSCEVYSLSVLRTVESRELFASLGKGNRNMTKTRCSGLLLVLLSVRATRGACSVSFFPSAE
jgi:hypothetical protein